MIDWTGTIRGAVGRVKRKRKGRVGSDDGPTLPLWILAVGSIVVGVWLTYWSLVLGLTYVCVAGYATRGWNQAQLQRRLYEPVYEPLDEPLDEPEGDYVMSVYAGTCGPTVTVHNAEGVVSREVFDSTTEAAEHVTQLEAYFCETGRNYRKISEEIA